MKNERLKAISTYITKIALTTLLTILVMQETSTWYNILKMNFSGYGNRVIFTAILEIICYIAIITTQTITFIIETKNIKQ